MALTNTNTLLDQIIGPTWQPGSPVGGRLGQLNSSQVSLREDLVELTRGLSVIGNNIMLLLNIKYKLEDNIKDLALKLEKANSELIKGIEAMRTAGVEKSVLTKELGKAEEKIKVTQDEINSLEQKLSAINQTLADVQVGLQQDKPNLVQVQTINDSMRDALGRNFEQWSPRQQVGGKRKRKKKSVKKNKRKSRDNKKGGYVYSLTKKAKNKSFRKHRK